ncbi:hypothetical protein BTO05_01560 [Winogradskyella sp. PC-19]|uniref:phosphatase PAP2 family protein n=1 Tax=unclassified Winogradskyella TaxID=2615021 RepID=UPI000B3C900A|nr:MULTISPECIES: phosphatase PAP2 family protein [unclassified Winogradskyella]ARV08391.1 hypothetical protein BTO05_01560 [Winogradskyella sp. PC-19]RZN74843.1 MAG: phosphatase PAP2 family protein [Winogradskyella sp.]
MKLKLILSFIFLFLGIYKSTSQQIKVKSDSARALTVWQMVKYDANNTVKSVGHAFTRPLHWKGDDFKKFGILVGSTTLLSLSDRSVREFSQNQPNFPKVVRDFGWYFGSPQNYFIANAGLYGFGLFTKNEKVRKTSVLIISASITTGLIQSFTKNAVGRARPGRDEGPYTFKPFQNDVGYSSFPSGHTILSMTMAHSIAKQFENPWIKVGIYSIGAIPPISRLIDDAHYFTDIFFSTALSIIVVDAIDKFLFESKAYDYPQKEKTISWNLRFSTNQIGFVGTF